ncbi:sugar ABC transporter ATP-binding protein [Streptosporangium amethystogenes]|uniref:sugar ABC transporter ATP-binding protein n=1 Tax=Streptosporangium amethystogenes TaxID=2002 RepID=UPI0004CBA246|nr:sugar ABC transporter ATP-binding protein [Streptosporangium amethystogenes]
MRATLELRNVEKSFPGARALKDVSLTAFAGRVHALLGENGAGKSTLIKIASGALQPDAGQLLVDGRRQRFTPRSAKAAGVRVLHQERQIALTRSVADNVLLDLPPRGRFGLVTGRGVAREAGRRLARVGADLDPDAPAWTLSVAQMQLLELARAVCADAKCIIMDEPTATLHRAEIDQLFSVVRQVRDSGIAVIYISHHLDEVMELADDYTVLRDGTKVHDGLVAEVTTGELVSHMFGDEVSMRRADIHEGAATPGPVAIELKDACFGGAVRSVSLKARRGEVLVVTGAVGCGSREVARLMAGAIQPTSGTVRILDGHRGGRRAATRAGVGFLPADRKREGLMLDRSIVENALLAENGMLRAPAFNPLSAARRATEVCRRLSVKLSDVRAPIRGLSGGNQQKVILARWLQVGSDVLVLDEPTAGVDIPSKSEIYRLLRERAAAGDAVVVFSTEYQEICCIADRVVVMRDGRIAGELDGESATEHRIFEMELGS